jgi:nicotinate-nucleotide adenylyltransferase
MDKKMKLLIENVKQYAISYESPKRFKHSVRVAKMATKLSKKYGADPEKAYFAGLAHDLCKEMGADALIDFAKTDGFPILDVEKNKPSLLHGRAAAVVVQNFFHMEDKDIIEAIRYHTSGKPFMSDLAKIIYVSDKIEPKRPQVNKAYYKKLFALDLDGMIHCIAQESIDYLNSKNKVVFESTKELLDSLESSKNKDKIEEKSCI